jgi:hypothetical protein
MRGHKEQSMTHAPAPQEQKKPAAGAARVDAPTTGERLFSRIRFGIAEAFILIVSAVLAYRSRYGEGTLKKWSETASQWVGGRVKDERLAAMFSSTLITSWGGWFFVPPMHWMDQKKEAIVTALNTRFGKPGEVEHGRENIRKEQKTSLFTVLLGRVASFAAVFGAFFAADRMLGKDAGENYKFDTYCKKFGAETHKLFYRLTFRSPARDAEIMQKRSYRYGEIVALDLFATTIAVALWTALNALFAGWSEKKTPAALPESTATRDVPALPVPVAAAAEPRLAASPRAETPTQKIETAALQQQHLVQTPAIAANAAQAAF